MMILIVFAIGKLSVFRLFTINFLWISWHLSPLFTSEDLNLIGGIEFRIASFNRLCRKTFCRSIFEILRPFVSLGPRYGSLSNR